MSNVILNHSSQEINEQTSNNQERIIVVLAKLKTMLELGLNCDLKIHTAFNLHNYLWVLSDLVEQLEMAMI